MVLVGVVGETVTELTDWIRPESRKKRIAKISALVLILGLTGDLLGIRETQVEVAFLTKEADDAKTSAKEAAAAAARANKYADGIARLSWPRQLDAEKFVTLLKGKSQARVKLLYNPNDSEAWSFARDIYWWLGKGVGSCKPKIVVPQRSNRYAVQRSVHRIWHNLSFEKCRHAIRSAAVGIGLQDEAIVWHLLVLCERRANGGSSYEHAAR